MENNLTVTDISDRPAKPSVISAENYGFNLPGTGNGTKICFVDSGVPDHEAITNLGGHINFTNSETFRDVVGHSTLLAGLVAGNKPDFIQGISPDAIAFFSKATSDDGSAAFDATVASVLWGVIKEVDVIAIPLVIGGFNLGLQQAINKAFESGICVVMASSDAQYKNVLSVSPIAERKQMAFFNGPNMISAPSKGFTSTYIEQQYAKVGGSATSVALVAGACLLAIEQMKKAKDAVHPISVFSKLASSMSKTE